MLYCETCLSQYYLCTCYEGEAKLRQGIALIEKEIEAIETLLNGHQEFKLWTRKSIGGRPRQLALTKADVEIADNGFRLVITAEFTVQKRTVFRHLGLQIQKKLFWSLLSPEVPVGPQDTFTVDWTLGF